MRTILALVLLTACGSGGPAAPPHRARYDAVPRLRFNQLALRLNLPLFWARDANENGALDPDEVRALLFYPSRGEWVAEGRFTPAFEEAYERIAQELSRPAPDDARRRLVQQEIDHMQVTLVETDLHAQPEVHRVFAQHMMRASSLIDALFAQQVGMNAVADQVAADPESQSLFRRNWGPHCRGATTDSEALCSAIPNNPGTPVDIYPANLQTSDSFCAPLEARADQAALLHQFSVVRDQNGSLAPVPYNQVYRDQMHAVSVELLAAADAMTDPEEAALVRYLRAAAQAFDSNDWDAADEAWSVMNSRNSLWYLRVAPDEVYWEPCSRHAGFHLTLARINRESLAWQDRLQPVQGDMERTLAALVPGEYEARQVAFHMPDFIDITLNAGDDRSPNGATIGQSLPNWGPVADQGRGRTVAMINLYTDPDSQAVRREQARSLIGEETLRYYGGTMQAGLLTTILHEATHNLGPAHEYRVNGQTDADIFGGSLSSMLEELKAQSGALFFIDWLRERGVITEQQARETYLDAVVWAFGHIARGMYTAAHRRQPYNQLSAIQMGFLMDEHVLRFEPQGTSAGGQTGVFSIDYDAFPAAARRLMTLVMHIKATGDRAGAERIATRYVDGDVVPQEMIHQRYDAFPQTTFVYAVEQ